MKAGRVRICAALLSFLTCLSVSALERQPNADYAARRQRVAAKLDGGIALVFAGVEDDGPNALYGFRQADDFYYLTGWTEPGAAVLIASPATKEKDGYERSYTEILFLPSRNKAGERWTGAKLGAESSGADTVTGFARVDTLDHLRDDLVALEPTPAAITQAAISNSLLRRPQIYVEGGQAAADKETPLQWLQRDNAFFGATGGFADLTAVTTSLRMVKDPGEIELVRKATDASIAAHQAAFKFVRPGVGEHDIEALMQYEFQKRGCERPAYAPIVGAGLNSTVLHYSDDDGPVHDGDLVVMDVAGEYSMYASDITRTVPANGHFTPRQREIYDIVLGAQEAAINAFVAGKSTLGRRKPNSLYEVAYEYINTHGKDLHGQPLGQYFIHGLGHQVGLNVHDVTDPERALDKGMVFTIEPGIYIPEEKLGVRIEDIFYVDENGKLVRLTAKLPHTADEVEKAMRK